MTWPDPQAAARLRAARLYAITPDAPAPRVEQLVGAWLRGGADVIQLRQKSMPRPQVLALALALARACAEAAALLIVDDQLDVALLAGAAGVHLGPNDLSLAGARRAAGDGLLIGASAASPQAAREAVAAGADYLGSGPAYSTPIKAAKRVLGPSGVAEVAAAVAIPVFAIGGIDRSRIAELRRAGVDRVCAIRALADAPDPEAEARALKAELAG